MTPAKIAPMPSKGRPKEIVRLSEEAVEALKAKAADEGVPKSDIMRRAIYRELDIQEDM
jgi:predicted DNA binding CopG/RHH family protein